jgi:hypothetical protein
MTFIPTKKILIVTLPLILSAGCVQSHRAPYAYTPAYSTTPNAVMVAPTSQYQTERVYSAPTETVVTTAPTRAPYEVSTVPTTGPIPVIVTEAPSTVPAAPTSSSDLVLAGEIRRVIAQDPDLIAAARDTRISIWAGVVTLTGTTVTRTERERLHRAIEGVPGIYKLDDRLRATLDRSN